MSGPRNVDLNPLVLSHFSRNNKKKKKTAMKCDRVLQKFFLSTKAKNKEEKRGINQKQGKEKRKTMEKLWRHFFFQHTIVQHFSPSICFYSHRILVSWNFICLDTRWHSSSILRFYQFKTFTVESNFYTSCQKLASISSL